MTDSPPAHPTPADAIPEGLVEVGAYGSYAAGFEHSIVVLAMGVPCWLTPDATTFRLMVEPAHEAAAARQLSCFDQESRYWPPRPVPEPAPRPLPFAGPLLWSIVVLAVFWGETTHPEWIQRAQLDREAVFVRHEAWRPFTALFLHADIAHVVANGITGIFAFSSVLASVGRRLGWLLLALAAFVGNVLAAGMSPAEYRSVGASTAVFAALGVLTGRATRRLLAHRTGRTLRTLATPFAAGLIVLGLYGAGGVRVDVLAHATGFASGLVPGAAVPPSFANGRRD